MSIKLRFEKGTLATQVLLKDAALTGLLKLIEEYQSDDPAPEAIGLVSSVISQQSSFGQPPVDRIAVTRDWLGKHSASELLNMFQWDTNPEKILLLGAFHEASGSGEGWRSADMEVRFSEAKEPSPANFPRDISNAIKAGIISTVTPRTYKVSRTGWNKVTEAASKLIS